MDIKQYFRDKGYSAKTPLPENPNLEMKLQQSKPKNSRHTAELFNVARQFAQLSAVNGRRYLEGNRTVH